MKITTVTVWLLLSLPADPANTQVLATYKTAEACVEAQATQAIAKRDSVCRELQIPARKAALTRQGAAERGDPRKG